MNEPLLHVTFGDSAGGDLRDALKKAGRDEEMISSIDDLSFGPIDPPDLQERLAWMRTEFDIHEYRIEQERIFWEKFQTYKGRKVLWTSGRHAMEYCGFLECLWRLGDTPCSVVDLTDVKVEVRGRDGNLLPPRLAVCLPLISEDTILENGILDMAEPLSSEDRARYHALWKKLRTENAPFRVVSAQGIASAPITYFDDEVLSCVKSEWQRSARVIGEVMGKEWPFQYIQTGDGVYFSRLQRLVERGVVESRGDMSKMRTSEVRLPATADTGKA